MRLALRVVASVGVVAVVGCTALSDDPVCGTSEAGPICAAHGLSRIDLRGTWTFTGTTTIYSYQPPNPPVMHASTRPVTIDVQGCMYTANGIPGMIDDTAANARISGPGTDSYSMTICAQADGTIRYGESASYVHIAHPGGTNGATVSEGILTR
jgi:hypothetical protein